MASSFAFYLILFAAAQGFVLAVLLATKQRRSAANLILAAWIILLVVDLVLVAAIVKGIHLLYPGLMTIKYGLPFVHGPCLYLYVRYLTAPAKRSIADLWHFLPFAASKLMLIPYAVMTHDERVSYIRNFDMTPPAREVAVSTILTAQGLIYVILTYLAVRHYRRNALQYFSYRERVSLSWLNSMLIINLAIWSLVVANRVLLFLKVQSPLGFYTYLLAALWILSIGYFGFQQPEIFSGEKAKPDEDSFESTEKYAKTRLNAEKKEEIRRALDGYMAKKPWLEPSLTIKDISNNTGFPIHHISQVINDVFGENLFSFINRHRLDEVKVRLSDPKLQDINVLHIALDCGFNSKSSFNNIFKQHTGITPSEFRRRASLQPSPFRN